MRVLGVDGGGSSTKFAVLSSEGLRVAQGRIPALSGHLFDPAQQAQAQKVLQELQQQTHLHQPQAIVTGITGLDALTPEALWMQQQLAQLFGLPADKVEVFNDMDLAYRAHFALGEGILVYGGTGAVAYHLNSVGAVVRAGGHGYRLGDEGGGYWIGKSALRQVLWWMDGGEPLNQPLAEALLAKMGVRDWPGIRAYVYGQGREAVAALAPVVGQVAPQDPTAQQILLEAGQALARLALTLQKRLGPLPVVLSGGVLEVSPWVGKGAKDLLEVTFSQTSHAEAAARLALKRLSHE